MDTKLQKTSRPRTGWSACALWLMLAALPFICFAGCSRELEPSEDAVLYYFRAASCHGRVTRIWPEGQSYVDEVLKARATFLKHHDALWDASDDSKLWDLDDPQWKDAEAVEGWLAELRRVKAVERIEADNALKALTKAIEKIPAGLDAKTPQEKAEFTHQVWAAMTYDHSDVSASLDALVGSVEEVQAIAEAAITCCANVGTTGPVLDAESCEPLAATHRAFTQRSNAMRAASLKAASDRIAADAAQRREHAKGTPAYRWHEDRMKFSRDWSKGKLQELRAIRDTCAAEVRTLEKKSKRDAKADTKLAFLKARLTRLDNQVASLKVKVDAIVAQWEAATSDSTDEQAADAAQKP